MVKDCNELVDDYIADKKITAYAVYKSGSSPSAGNLIVAEDVNATWSKFKNKNVMSAAAYAQGLSGEDVLSRLMKQKCTVGADDQSFGYGLRAGLSDVGSYFRL